MFFGFVSCTMVWCRDYKAALRIRTSLVQISTLWWTCQLASGKPSPPSRNARIIIFMYLTEKVCLQIVSKCCVLIFSHYQKDCDANAKHYYIFLIIIKKMSTGHPWGVCFRITLQISKSVDFGIQFKSMLKQKSTNVAFLIIV